MKYLRYLRVLLSVLVFYTCSLKELPYSSVSLNQDIPAKSTDVQTNQLGPQPPPGHPVEGGKLAVSSGQEVSIILFILDLPTPCGLGVARALENIDFVKLANITFIYSGVGIGAIISALYAQNGSSAFAEWHLIPFFEKREKIKNERDWSLYTKKWTAETFGNISQGALKYPFYLLSQPENIMGKWGVVNSQLSQELYTGINYTMHYLFSNNGHLSKLKNTLKINQIWLATHAPVSDLSLTNYGIDVIFPLNDHNQLPVLQKIANCSVEMDRLLKNKFKLVK